MPVAIFFTVVLVFTVGDFTVRNWNDIVRAYSTGYAKTQHEIAVAQAKDLLAKEFNKVAKVSAR